MKRVTQAKSSNEAKRELSNEELDRVVGGATSGSTATISAADLPKLAVSQIYQITHPADPVIKKPGIVARGF